MKDIGIGTPFIGKICAVSENEIADKKLPLLHGSFFMIETRYSGGVREGLTDTQTAENLFFQDGKRAGAGGKDGFVEGLKVKSVAQSFFAGSAQIQKAQVTKVVFQIIGRIFKDILVKVLHGGLVGYAETVQEGSRIFQCPAVAMDADIQQGCQTQIH